MMEIKHNFPSSEMIQKLALALGIDPTELFFKEIDPATKIKNSQKVAFEEVGEAVSQFLSCYIAEKVRDLDTETKEEGE
jgi:transcriptional regulator with XRE-family HTH domain